MTTHQLPDGALVVERSPGPQHTVTVGLSGHHHESAAETLLDWLTASPRLAALVAAAITGRYGDGGLAHVHARQAARDALAWRLAAMQVHLTPDEAEGLSEDLADAALEPLPCSRPGCTGYAADKSGECVEHQDGPTAPTRAPLAPPLSAGPVALEQEQYAAAAAQKYGGQW